MYRITKVVSLICLMVAVYSTSVMASAPGTQPEELSDNSGLGSMELAPSAEDLARDMLSARNEKLVDEGKQDQQWNEGFNKKIGKYIAIGSGPIPVNASHPGFGGARVVAFKKAMLAAKEQMAAYMAQEVSRKIERILSAPDQTAAIAEQETKASEQPGIMDKSTALVNAELDRLLKERNVDMSSPEKVQKEVEQLLQSDTFSDVIKASARAEVAGLLVYKIIEAVPEGNTGEVAVIAICSSKSKQMAAALLGKGSAPVGKAKNSISAWVKGLDKKILIATHGVKPRVDQNGNLNLVAFGMAFPRTASSTSTNISRKKARIQALGYLRSFAGEMVVTSEASDDASTFKEFADNTSTFASQDSFESVTTARADSLKMPGINTVHSWRFIDSRSGKPVVGTVMAWNLGNAKDANALRDQMNKLGGSKGGEGVTAKSKPVSRPVSTGEPAKANDSPYVRSGVTGDDDDF